MSPPFVMASADGYRVELVEVRRSLRRPPRLFLRVRWRGYYVADCSSVAQVAAHVELASLVVVPA